MQRRSLTAPAATRFELLHALLAHWLEEEGAIVRICHERRGRPGSRHWHLAHATGGGGTLEVTLDPGDPSEINVDVHDNRRGIWSVPAQERLYAFLRRELARDRIA